ncbi:MAG: hypothetical protein D6748_14040 [Calditrichaeota bacterium]|nr:MAG: hypothetical protein D6748_14040 [Calditrichota bacterium]
MISDNAICEVIRPDGVDIIRSNVIAAEDKIFVYEHTALEKAHSLFDILVEIFISVLGIFLFIGTIIGNSDLWNTIFLVLSCLWVLLAVVWLIMTLIKWYYTAKGINIRVLKDETGYFRCEVDLRSFVSKIEGAKGKGVSITDNKGTENIVLKLTDKETKRVLKYYNKQMIQS